MLLAFDTSSFRLQQMLELLSNPAVLLGAVVLAVFTASATLTGKGRLVLVTCMLTASVFAVFTRFEKWLAPPPPLDTMVFYARTITTAFLGALVIPALLPLKRSSYAFVVSPVAIALLIFQICYCLRFLLGGYPGEAVQRIAAFTGVFLVMGVALPNWLEGGQQFGRLLFYLVLSLAFVCFCNLYGALIDPSDMEHHGRFFGIGGNQNHMAISLAGFYPAMLAFLSLSKRSVVWKVGVLFLLLLSVVFLIWTGSRSGAWTAALMVLVFYRRRLKALLLIGASAALLFSYMFVGLFVEADEQSERLISTENTRLGDWAYAMERFYDNPLFGSTLGGFNVLPGSYVTLIACMGIIGVVVVMPFVVTCFMLIARLWRIPKTDGSNLDVVGDMVIAAIVGFAFHSIFEGTLFSNLSFTILAIYIYIAFGELAARAHAGAIAPVAAARPDELPARASLQGAG